MASANTEQSSKSHNVGPLQSLKYWFRQDTFQQIFWYFLEIALERIKNNFKAVVGFYFRIN